MTTATTADLSRLTGGSRRPRVHNAQMVFKAPADVKALVEQYAAEQSEAKGYTISAADVLRFAIAEYFERRGFGDK